MEVRPARTSSPCKGETYYLHRVYETNVTTNPTTITTPKGKIMDTARTYPTTKVTMLFRDAVATRGLADSFSNWREKIKISYCNLFHTCSGAGEM